MLESTSGAIGQRPEGDSLMAHLDQQPTLTNFIKQAGLTELADTIEGDNFIVCDIQLHGVQGCADIRDAMENQQMAAECIALGLVILVAVIVGSIAVGFINLATKLAAPIGRNRVYALFPRRKATYIGTETA